MSLEADARWKACAQGLAAPSPRTGITVAPRADNLFGALYSRMLLVDPSAPPPQSPPATAFLGDGVAVGLGSGSPSFRSGERRGLGDGEPDEAADLGEGADSPPPAPSSPGTNPPAKEGVLRLVASAPNAAGS